MALGDHNIFTPGPGAGRAIGAGDDVIIGGAANEDLVGDSSTDNPAVTEAGNDVIKGRGGDDRLFGDNTNFDVTATTGTVGGDDRLRGGTGSDTLRAGSAADFLDGGPQTDHCDGEAGTDKAKGCETVLGVP